MDKYKKLTEEKLSYNNKEGIEIKKMEVFNG